MNGLILQWGTVTNSIREDKHNIVKYNTDCPFSTRPTVIANAGFENDLYGRFALDGFSTYNTKDQFSFRVADHTPACITWIAIGI